MHPTFRFACAAAMAAALALPATSAGAAGGSSGAPSAAKPANPDFANGKAAIDRKDYTGAVASLTRVTQAEPRNANAWNLLGFATRKSGNPRGSLAHYQKALEIDPKHLGAHEYMGEAYLMLDDLPNAEILLKRLDSFCVFGCQEHRMLKSAIDNYKRGRKPTG
ncbi:MAG: tetratricopeptide repeat protein [Alphaproteobacteria bacterium]|nr:tetratricopeptide repeat protein [Alphaproteobacteria bacterium]MCW5740498.1 tetratricopeptide repeat protein [Alphaproteobacteria bacterium]